VLISFLLLRNNQLPESQRLRAKDLELDSRITSDLHDKLERQMDVVRQKKQFDFEKVKLCGKKLMEHFIDPIEHPIQVIGIRNGQSVFSFRIRKLGSDYSRLKDDIEAKLRDLAKRKR